MLLLRCPPRRTGSPRSCRIENGRNAGLIPPGGPQTPEERDHSERVRKTRWAFVVSCFYVVRSGGLEVRVPAELKMRGTRDLSRRKVRKVQRRQPIPRGCEGYRRLGCFLPFRCPLRRTGSPRSWRIENERNAGFIPPEGPQNSRGESQFPGGAKGTVGLVVSCL